MTSKYFITADIGGTNTRVSIINDKFDVTSIKSFKTPKNNPKSLLEKIRGTIQTLLQTPGISGCIFEGVGIAIAGLVRNGKLIKDIRVGLSDYDLHGYLRTLGSKNVLITNDCVAQAVGEYHAFSDINNRDPFIYISFGTGIGGAILINGKPLVGSRGFYSDIGHIKVVPGGPLCGCGAKGCFEALVGGESIKKRFGINAKELFNSQNFNEAKKEIGFIISQALSTLYHLFDPRLVVFGGSLMNSYNQIKPFIDEGLTIHLTSIFRENIQIKVNRLGDQAGLIGTAKMLASITKTENN